MNVKANQAPWIEVQARPAPPCWREPCSNIECSLHQLSPYIGKIKSSIAGELIEQYSRKGDLVVDPFAGAGTIPLEAAIRGRRAFGADISPYARILSQAKLSPPPSFDSAFHAAEHALAEARELPQPDLRSTPQWVRRFFHPDTLREAIQFAEVARRPGNEFLLANFLGILHHQRPGFLSYPSSHLVPYLRDKKYPREEFPEMYSYRELRRRLIAKIQRSYKRFSRPRASGVTFRQSAVQHLRLPARFDALITSPPYMNAIVEAFGNVANSHLNFLNVKNEEGSSPKQATRIEPYEPFDLSVDAQRLYEELLRYSVFIEDFRGKSRRGSVVPRLYLRRFLIPHFNLTFSTHDSIELEPADFETFLMSPQNFDQKFRLKSADDANRFHKQQSEAKNQLPLKLD